VRFVVVGTVSAILQGAPLVSLDIDIVPERSEANLWNLSRFLRGIGAEVRGAGKVTNHPDGDWLNAASFWNFQTPLGDLDVLFVPLGTTGFDSLSSHAVSVDLGEDLVVLVASLDDLIAMKEAANRPKDHLALPILRWLRDRDQPSP
jgi:hypothetical protein